MVAFLDFVGLYFYFEKEGDKDRQRALLRTGSPRDIHKCQGWGQSQELET